MSEKLPDVLTSICLLVQRHATPNGPLGAPQVTAVSIGDRQALQNVVNTQGVVEAAIYEVTSVTLIGTKTVSVVTEGVLDRD